ncbi:MAG TPA: HAMP domain-containing sensor histidine kinase [Solirubrobacteraceae bacterium]|nr:HAMP domain-containing sensor histidine kinase [Solirubrobacteraceae bacterium]
MASPGSSIRSAAQATYSAYRRVPVRWRLAGGSAVLTLVILCGFAVIVGALTIQRIRDDFDEQTRLAANDLADRLQYKIDPRTGRPGCVGPDLGTYAGAENAVIRVIRANGQVLCQTNHAPNLGVPTEATENVAGYRVESRPSQLLAGESALIQYARPLSSVNHTVSRVRLLLAIGVLAGGALALLAGLFVARRAMRPIAELTRVASEIERTRDPSLEVPHPEAEDEVAELARTLEGMLRALDESRTQTEAMLERQRQFIADISHELRTPLTSVLANLELLSVMLEGDERETAESALRSTKRMRRLVADLLLLARADAGRVSAREPTDLASVVMDAAAELEPIAEGHEITVEAEPAVVSGARDELLRMASNLIANAIRHTPPGTEVRAGVGLRDGGVELAVTDDGPGVPPDLAPHVFERFVRGGGDRAGSSGLGLAIVRAVAEAHGGTVVLETPEGGGARFVVRLPAAEPARAAPEPVTAG